MRQLLVIGLAMGLVSAAASFVLINDVPDSVEGNHSAPGTPDTHIVHNHDDYYHPEPLTGPWANHAAAMADCQAASPAPQCTMTIDAVVGDKVEWWTKSPFHVNPHTVTECTDGSFSVCGAAVDPVNPIGDSGVIAGGASSSTLQYGPITFTTAGAYFYRCDIHPFTMRGRVLVQNVGTPPAGQPAVGGIVGLTEGEGSPASQGTDNSHASVWLIAAAGVTAVIVAAGGAGLWKRAARRPVELDEER